jgi:hypothetical protein
MTVECTMCQICRHSKDLIKAKLGIWFVSLYLHMYHVCIMDIYLLDEFLSDLVLLRISGPGVGGGHLEPILLNSFGRNQRTKF